jgi:hypothetical protein
MRIPTFRATLTAGTIALASAGFLPRAAAQESAISQWLTHLENRLPKTAADCATNKAGPVEEAADAIELWAAELASFRALSRAEQIVSRVEELVAAQDRVDRLLERMLALRTAFAAADLGDNERPAIRRYLRLSTTLIDLAGRTRYQLRDTLDMAAYQIASRPDLRDKVIDLLIERKSQIGAAVMAAALFDPPPDAANRARPANDATKAKLLELIARTGEISQLPTLARFVRASGQQPELVVAAADAIRRVGLPQDPRPGQEDDKDIPKPDITAADLHGILSKLPAAQLSAKASQKHDELVTWLAARKAKGIEEDSLRLGHFDVRPGDFMLMRNPSPYNLFTDLSPGLFTHVGVVTEETAKDGKRRIVVVDLPERGRQIPATAVEAYVQRSLHYMFLRHPDPPVAKKLAETAAAIIGNPSEFDLNFRTESVLPLKGKPLAGQKIKTYCAGLLLVCAQETGRPRESFFPIAERGAGGNAPANIAKMGFSCGKDFISPTGALFSPELQIVGRRAPLYDPVREIEEAVFDHFAAGLETKTYVPSLSFAQSLRLKLAEYAKDSPELADAIRREANVGSEVDLVAAAKAQAFVETLDEVAYGHSRMFMDAHLALTTPDLDALVEQGYTGDQVTALKQLRQQHAAIYRRLSQMTPRGLRIELVNIYANRGKTEIDRRFFGRKE